jgi:hypothetical protein
MKLEIVLPKTGNIDIPAAIKNRENWIVKHYKRLSANSRILSEDAVMYEGDLLSIVFEKTEEKEEILPDPVHHRVIVRASDRSRIRELVRRWFLHETSHYIVGKLEKLSGGLSVKYSRADVRQMKNWGYCTKDRRLSFSWQLIALPEPLREYVVMHELAHLDHFNHSTAFKKRLGELCPDYEAREIALDKIVPGRISDY